MDELQALFSHARKHFQRNDKSLSLGDARAAQSASIPATTQVAADDAPAPVTLTHLLSAMWVDISPSLMESSQTHILSHHSFQPQPVAAAREQLQKALMLDSADLRQSSRNNDFTCCLHIEIDSNIPAFWNHLFTRLSGTRNKSCT
jgi:hypothetical protein